MGWTWRSIENKTWDDYYNELLQIYNETKSSTFKQKVNPALFQWCRGQRQKKDLLLPEQIKKLNDIEFDWKIKIIKSAIQPKNDLKFEENAKQLPRYKNENGEFKFKSRDKVSEWVRKLRLTGTSDERKKILLKYGYDLDEDIKRNKGQ